MAFLAAVTAIGLATGSSCTIKDPCFNAPPPPADVLAVDAKYPQIEMDYVISDTVECDLVNNKWQREAE
jgi:hypothetical protein